MNQTKLFISTAKLLIMNSKSLILLCLLLAAVSQSASGALLYNDLATDSDGNFANPGTTGWSGTGTVVGPAGFGVVGGSGNTMINDFTGSGNILTLGPATGWGSTLLMPTTATMAVSLGGGSGDIAVNLHGQPVPPSDERLRPIGFNVTDLKGGVTSVTVEFNWSEPIAPAYDPARIPFAGQPFLVGFRTQGAGNPWNFDAEYLGLRYTTDTGTPVTFSGGLPAGVDSLDMGANSFNWGSEASFSGTSSNGQWQGVHLFDIDGDAIYDPAVNGDSILQDAEAVYATGMRFTFTPGAGDVDGLLDGANFLFSTNGGQYVDTFADSLNVVPEPTGTMLLGLGGVTLMLRRKRS